VNGDYVDLSNGDMSKFAFSGRAPFTLEIWVRPDLIDTQFRTHLHKGDGSPDRWNLDVQTDFGFACHRTVGGVNRGPTQSTDFRPLVGRYLHLVCTYDGSYIRLYANGRPVGATVFDDRSLPAIATRAEIGPDALSTIDEVAVYPAALTPERIVAHYEAGIGALGERKFTSSQGFALNDRSGLGVNVCTGNLLVHASDLHIESRGVDVDVDRWYNGLPADGGKLGLGWWLGTGNDVQLRTTPNGSMVFLGPSGYRAVFVKQGDGTFAQPSGLDARLVRNGDSTYTLSWNGTPFKYTFDAGLDFVDIRDRNGNKIWFSRTGGDVTAINDAQGRQTTLTYNPLGLLASINDVANRTWLYAYDASNRLITYTDPENGITRYEYDGNGRLSKIISPGARQTVIAYDAKGRVASVKRVTDILAQTGPTTSYEYNTGNTVVIDPRTYRTTYTCEDPGRVTSVTDPLQFTASASFSANSDMLSFTNELGKIWSFGYDANFNATSMRTPTTAPAPNPPNRSWTYDLSGPNPYYASGGTDAQGNQTNYGYDANGNLTEKSDGPAPGQNPIHFTYNSNGTLATATDGRNTQTSYSYDGQGQLTRVDHPAPLGDVTYTYDSVSRVRTETDGKNQVTTYTYDKLDRITRVDFQDNSSVTYVYDGDGNRTSRTDNTGNSSYDFDALNRLTREALSNVTTTYGYDASSNLISATDAGGTTTYEYDGANHLIALTDPASARTSFINYPNGIRKETHYPNGVTLCQTYDDAERLTAIVALQGIGCGTAPILTSFSYSYELNGVDTDLRQSMISHYPDGDLTTTYTYDSLNRLLSSSGLGGSYGYAYDANGNITSASSPSGTSTYTHNAANQITNAGYSYDANGNETAAPGLSFAYNAKDQTSQINGAANTYAGTNQWEVPTFRASTTLRHSALGINSRTLSGATDRYTRDPAGTLISLRASGGQTYYYLFDGLGSIIALTDSSASIVATYKYAPYGELLGSPGPIENPWHYAGGYLDTATGLYKYGLRYYDPRQARWTQRDAIEQPLAEPGWNDYLYAGCDPTKRMSRASWIFGDGGPGVIVRSLRR
jgi:RHS repeat-associated protein